MTFLLVKSWVDNGLYVFSIYSILDMSVYVQQTTGPPLRASQTHSDDNI